MAYRAGQSMFFVQRQHIIDRAAKHKASRHLRVEFIRPSGGLISYGADVPDIYPAPRDSSTRSSKGAKPADLPVEGPKLFDMAVDLKTARPSA